MIFIPVAPIVSAGVLHFAIFEKVLPMAHNHLGLAFALLGAGMVGLVISWFYLVRRDKALRNH